METLKSGATAPLNEQQQRKRRFYLVLPLLILPFMTLGFWALGGGRGVPLSQVRSDSKGLDATLPQAQFKAQQAQSKMAVYQESKTPTDGEAGISPDFMNSLGISKKDSVTNSQDGMAFSEAAPSAAEQSEKIEAKLAQINRHLQEPSRPDTYEDAEEQITAKKVKKLNQMVRSTGSSAPDPEMQQLSQMLRQIQAIQNPESVKETKPKVKSEKAFKAIPAIIDGDQKITDGAAVKLKLTDSVTLKQVVLPTGQAIFGISQVVNQRLLIRIKNIRVDESIIPVDLIVFSLDGMEGIPAPEAELGEAAGNGASNALQNMQILSMDQSISSQAAASGINAAKGLFNKKIKKIKVKLSDEYPLLLKINR